MISFILFNVAFLIIIYNIYQYMFFRPKNFPPGPPKIPFFGSYLFLLLLNKDHLHYAVIKLCTFYKTNILGFYLGTTPLVVMNSGEKVKQSLLHREFDGKPDLVVARLREPNMNLFGIFFTEGQHWFEQRRFALRYLRDFGFGRRYDVLEREIQTELSQYMEVLKYGPKFEFEKKYIRDGKVNLPRAFGPIFGNCFLEVLFNERIPHKDMIVLYEAAEMALKFQRTTDLYGKMYSIIPSLTKWFPKLSGFEEARFASTKLHAYFKERIDYYSKTYDPMHERNFIDMYITQIKKAEESGEETSFTYDQLILTCIDFTFPPLSALSPTVTFLIQQICFDPLIQYKIQKEIDNVVGDGRLPTLDDRINLPYTEACLREIMRFETLVPSGLPHKALMDTEFMGYSIPKGTIVMPALHALSADRSIWSQPEKFQPERFLDETGKLTLSKDHSLPFGAGKRLCAGETFARNMLFLFTAAFFQSFNVSLPPTQKPIHFSDNLTGLIRTTPDHWIQLHSR